MSIRKERIKSTNQDINIKFSLGTNNYRYGYQQEIDGLTEQVKNDLIDSVDDYEVRRFRYKSPTNSPINLKFYFTNDGSSYENSFLSDGANFTDSEILDNVEKVRNSFFIIDYYDNFNFFSQNKIFTSYNTKILNSETVTTTPSTTTPIPKYRIFNNPNNQFFYWYVPKTLINENLSSGNTIVTGYVRFNFYNAKTGQLLLFYNKHNESLSTSERLYFKVKLDLNNMTWYFERNATTYNAYQIPLTNAYSQRTNESISKIENKQQEFPEGSVFNPEEQDYETE